MKLKGGVLALIVLDVAGPCSGQDSAPKPQRPDSDFGSIPARAYSPDWSSVTLFEHIQDDATKEAILAYRGSFVARLSAEPPVDAVLGRYRGKAREEGNFVALVAYQGGAKRVLDVHTWKGRAIPSFYWRDGWHLSFVPETDIVATIGVKDGRIELVEAGE